MPAIFALFAFFAIISMIGVGLFIVYIILNVAFNTVVALLPTMIIALAVGGTIILGALHRWILDVLKTNSPVREAVELRINGDGVSWQIDPLKSLEWHRFAPLKYAAAAAASILIAGIFISVGRPETAIVTMFWTEPVIRKPAPELLFYGGFLSGLGIVFGIAFFAAPTVKIRAQKYILQRVIQHIATRFSTETDILKAIVELEQEIIDLYSSIGIQMRNSATELCRELVLREVTISSQETRGELIRIRDALEFEIQELQECIMLYEETRSSFEETKTAVIRVGSATLIDELDRIKLGLESDLLRTLLEDRKWEETREVLRLIDRKSVV